MVNINIFAQEGGVTAEANCAVASSYWLSIKHGGTDVTLYGTARQMEAFRKVAAILNEAFADEKPDEFGGFHPLLSSPVNLDDIPF